MRKRFEGDVGRGFVVFGRDAVTDAERFFSYLFLLQDIFGVLYPIQ